MTTVEAEVTSPRVHLVTVEGDLDYVTADGLTVDLDGLLDAGVEDVVVDLSAAEFIDSSGLGALVALCNSTTQAGLRFRTDVTSGPNLDTVTLAGLRDYLQVRVV